MALKEAGSAALLSGAAESGRREGEKWSWNQKGEATLRKEEGGSWYFVGSRGKPDLLMVSSSSESPRLVLSSSLVMRVEELS